MANPNDKIRDPCSKYNETTTRAGTATNCCDNCANATCHYVAHFRCTVWVPGGANLDEWERLVMPCLIFKKDCVQGCTWSSRWDHYCTEARLHQNELRPECDLPILGGGKAVATNDTATCSPTFSCEFPCSDADTREEDLVEYVLNQYQPTCLATAGICCHWGDATDSLYDGFHSVSGGLIHLCGNPAVDSDDPTSRCYRKGVLEIGESESTITLRSRQGLEAVYTCTDFNCIGQSTFRLTSRSDEVVGMPTCICLTSVKLDCDDSSCFNAPDEQECPCCLDFDCGLPSYVSVCGATPVAPDPLCDNPGGAGSGLCWVNTGEGTDLGCDVTTETGLCGHWLGSIDCPDTGRLVFNAYCIGENEWQLDTYCCGSGDCPDAACVLQTSSLSNVTCECSGIHFEAEFTLSTDCECCGCQVAECLENNCENAPTVLNVAWSAESGQSGTFTATDSGSCVYTGGHDYGNFCVVELDSFDLLNCTATWTVAGSCPPVSATSITLNSCDPFDVTLTFEVGSCDCPGCPPCDMTGTITVHVYE